MEKKHGNYGKRMKKSANWKGGIKIREGWRYIYVGNGKYVEEHRLVWLKEYGDIPKGYIIHHINGIRDDNRIENLQMMTKSEHSKLHSKERDLAMEKNPNWRGGKSKPNRCSECGVEVDYRSNICRSCSMKRVRKNKFWKTRGLS